MDIEYTKKLITGVLAGNVHNAMDLRKRLPSILRQLEAAERFYKQVKQVSDSGDCGRMLEGYCKSFEEETR